MQSYGEKGVRKKFFKQLVENGKTLTYLRSAPINPIAHPESKNKPPTGVMGPKNFQWAISKKPFNESKYKEPLNNIMPMMKHQPEYFIHVSF